jgi:hypothetical protein
MADSKLTALTEISVPALGDLTYAVDVSDTTDDAAGSSRKLTVQRLLGLVKPCQGRLTTETGVPVSTTDRTAQSTIYFTPYQGNALSVYDGTRWVLYLFSEISLALSGLTSGKNYDVFVYDNAGTLTLELSAAWTTDTARADALTTQDGVLVKSGATTRRYLGTIRTTGTTTTEDSIGGSTTNVGGKRFVWNYYNRVPRNLAVIDTTDNWTYATDTIRQARATAGNQVEYVVGDASTLAWAEVKAMVAISSTSTRAGKVGVGVDSTTVFSGLRQGAYMNNGAAWSNYSALAGRYDGYPGLGYHFLAWLEKGSDGTCIFLGDNGADGQQTGMIAQVMG